MTSLAAAIVLASLLAQPPAAPGTPAAPAPAAQPAAPAPAAPVATPPAASADAAGTWVVGMPKFYRVEETTSDLTGPVDNPAAKPSETKNKVSYIVRFIPRSLGASKQTFEMMVVEFKGTTTLMIGEMTFDSSAKEEPKDKASLQFGKLVKRIVGVPVSIDVEGGKITSVTGNESLTDAKAPGGGIVDKFFGDAAISEQFGYCIASGGTGVKMEPGAAWPIDVKVDFHKLLAIDLPIIAAVKSVKDGLATVVLGQREPGKVAAVPGAPGKVEGTLKENLYAGELVWNVAENRLQSGDYTTGFVVTLDTGKAKTEQRSIRTHKVVRADAPK